jgi:hypothetical protein
LRTASTIIFAVNCATEPVPYLNGERRGCRCSAGVAGRGHKEKTMNASYSGALACGLVVGSALALAIEAAPAGMKHEPEGELVRVAEAAHGEQVVLHGVGIGKVDSAVFAGVDHAFVVGVHSVFVS